MAVLKFETDHLFNITATLDINDSKSWTQTQRKIKKCLYRLNYRSSVVILITALPNATYSIQIAFLILKLIINHYNNIKTILSRN